MLSFQLQNPVMILHPESSVAAICNRQNISKLSGVKSVSTAISSEHNIQKSQDSREEKQNIMQPRKKKHKTNKQLDQRVFKTTEILRH